MIYRCERCENSFEYFEKRLDAVECPSCGSLEVYAKGVECIFCCKNEDDTIDGMPVCDSCRDGMAQKKEVCLAFLESEEAAQERHKELFLLNTVHGCAFKKHHLELFDDDFLKKLWSDFLDEMDEETERWLSEYCKNDDTGDFSLFLREHERELDWGDVL